MARPREFIGEFKPVGSRIPVEIYDIVSKGLGRMSDSKFILEKYELAAEEISKSLSGTLSRDSINCAVKGNDLEIELTDIERKIRVAFQNKENEKLRPLLGISRRINAMIYTATEPKVSRKRLSDRLLEEQRRDVTDYLKERRERKENQIKTEAIRLAPETGGKVELELQNLINLEKSRYHEEPMPKVETKVIDEEDENVTFYSEE
jgi:hypothetical protein